MKKPTIFRVSLGLVSLMASILCAAIPACSDVRLPVIFSDHMVLQRDMKIPVWGWANSMRVGEDSSRRRRSQADRG